MSNKVFQQNLDDKKGPQPGGPYLIQMLFKEPVEMPNKEKAAPGGRLCFNRKNRTNVS